MADESCIHCGQPAEDDDRETGSGRVHERCWDAFSEERPVKKLSVVAGIFGFSMAAAGAFVLSFGLAALSMAEVLRTLDPQNPLVGIPAAIMMFVAICVAGLAILAGAIMLSIAFLMWVATNNNAFKNYVAGGVAMTALAAIVVGPTLLSWVNSYEWSRPTNSFEEPNPVKPDGTYTIIDEQQGYMPDGSVTGSEQVWVGGEMVGYAEQTFWSNGELRSDNRADGGMPRETWFYENGTKKAEHWADYEHTGWWGYWYENGQQKYALNLVNAKREGPQVYWYENGQEMLRGNYLGGLPDGPLSEWDANGKETRLCSGNGVTLNGYCTKEGLFTVSHENGQKKSEGTYLNGLLEGVFTVWHENGQKKSEETYHKGRKEGVLTYWDEDGNCLRGCQ